MAETKKPASKTPASKKPTKPTIEDDSGNDSHDMQKCSTCGILYPELEGFWKYDTATGSQVFVCSAVPGDCPRSA